MQVEGRDLLDALKTDIPPVVLICGDETLLVEEACDQVLTNARTAGFDDVTSGSQKADSSGNHCLKKRKACRCLVVEKSSTCACSPCEWKGNPPRRS
jgi:hypothetical protein